MFLMYFGTDVRIKCIVYLVVIIHNHQRINRHLPSLVSFIF